MAILLKSLLKHGFNAGALHGDMDQMSRTATLDAFREGRITLLAASDVAARGLDIPDVSHIFNFDVPWQSDDYVHRIGRTGRAGKEGRSLTLVTPDDAKQLKDIERMLGAPVTWIGDPPSAEDLASGKRGRGRGGRGGAAPQRFGDRERAASGRGSAACPQRNGAHAPAAPNGTQRPSSRACTPRPEPASPARGPRTRPARGRAAVRRGARPQPQRREQPPGPHAAAAEAAQDCSPARSGSPQRKRAHRDGRPRGRPPSASAITSRPS